MYTSLMFDSDTLTSLELSALADIKKTPDYSDEEVRFYLAMKK